VLTRGKKLATFGYLVIEWPRLYRRKQAYAQDSITTIKRGRKHTEYVPLDVCTKEGLRNVANVVVLVLGGTRTGKGRVDGYFDNGIMALHYFGDYYGLINGERFSVSQLDEQKYGPDFNELLNNFAELGGRDLVIHPNKPKTIYFDSPAGDNFDVACKLVAHFASKYHFALKPYSAIEYNPHLNILVPGEFLDNLEQIKADLRRELQCPELIVHYDYFDEVPRMVNKLKYITRATYLDERWFPELRHELFNFRNVRYWGKWNMPVAWHTQGEEFYETIAKLESCECPDCHVKLKASAPVSSRYFDLWQSQGRTVAIGASYFELKHDDAGAPGHLDVSELVPLFDSMYRYADEHLRLDKHRELLLKLHGGQKTMGIKTDDYYSKGA
jgi:hypothetical protein